MHETNILSLDLNLQIQQVKLFIWAFYLFGVFFSCYVEFCKRYRTPLNGLQSPHTTEVFYPKVFQQDFRLKWLLSNQLCIWLLAASQLIPFCFVP